MGEQPTETGLWVDCEDHAPRKLGLLNYALSPLALGTFWTNDHRV